MSTKALYCPCQLESKDILQKVIKLYEEANNMDEFVQSFNDHQIKGKQLIYDKKEHMLKIMKRHACECEEEGDKCSSCPSSNKCHCDYARKFKSEKPLAHCQCGAEYYRTLFEIVFGKGLDIYPYETVLSGNERCVIAIQLPKEVSK